MICCNQKIHTLTFEEYLGLPGCSFSGIRNEGTEPFSSKKMQLGTDVHNYLLTPELYSHENVALVKPIALALKQAIGPLFAYLQPEMAVTANFVAQGFTMPYKGRIDLGIPKRIVVDIKVSEMDISKGVSWFGYDKQLSGYSIAIGAKAAIIVSVNPKTFKTKITNIPIDAAWWEYQVIQRGNIL
jgi:hypothetical protein